MALNSDKFHEKESCSGVIPLQKREETWFVLLIKHKKGHWAFPKGHVEAGENLKQAAERELKEECGLKIKRYFPLPPLQESYHFLEGGRAHHKTVSYFLAEISSDSEIVLKEDEIEKYIWIKLNEAQDYLTYPESKEICSHAMELLKEKKF
jgi:bis(5'-nucleosidyl)-tetraphosphatase